MNVRVKLDENIPRTIRDRFVTMGFDVHDVYDEDLAGTVDSRIRSACESEARVLVTLDTDFSDARSYGQRGTPGVVLLRPHSMSTRALASCAETAISALASWDVSDLLWIVEPGRLRVRDLAP